MEGVDHRQYYLCKNPTCLLAFVLSSTMNVSAVFILPSTSWEAEKVAFQRLLGVPLFLRGILTFASAGFRRIALIAPAHTRRQIMKAWQKFAVGRGITLELIPCRPEHRLTHGDIEFLRRAVAPRFLFLDTNTLVTPGWVRDVARQALTHGGVYTGPGRLIPSRELAAWQRMLPPNGLRIDRLTAPATAGKDNGPQVFAVATRKDWGRAERFLCEDIRRTTTGTVARWLNKRISLPISRILSRLRVHPHIITACNMVVGLAAGIGTGGMTYWGLLAGAALFQCASILDGCDGEVAKLTFRTSKFGQYIDTISDNFALVSFLTGLVIHHYRVVDPSTAVAWGLLLFSGLATLFTIMVRFLKNHTDSASLVTFEREYVTRLAQQRRTWLARFAQSGKALMKKDAFTLVALGFAIAGCLPVWLYVASVAIWIAVFTVLGLRWQPRWAPQTRAVLSRILGTRGEKSDAF